MVNVAVIPARGGSRRIPGKNIKEFCGKPMIAWPIELARSAGVFDHIIVSTDDELVAEKAKMFGAEVPFIRPPELADEYTGTIDVIGHAADWMATQNWNPTAICCIYATAPLLDPRELVQGLQLLTEGDWQYVFSAAAYSSSVYRAFRQESDGGVKMLFPEQTNTRSQDLPEVLHDAAQFYWGTSDAWQQRQAIFSVQSMPLRIPAWRVQDIDEPDDWTRAEFIHQQLREVRM